MACKNSKLFVFWVEPMIGCVSDYLLSHWEWMNNRCTDYLHEHLTLKTINRYLFDSVFVLTITTYPFLPTAVQCLVPDQMENWRWDAGVVKFVHLSWWYFTCLAVVGSLVPDCQHRPNWELSLGYWRRPFYSLVLMIFYLSCSCREPGTWLPVQINWRTSTGMLVLSILLTQH